MNEVPYIRQWLNGLFALFILSIFSTMAAVAEAPLWSATQKLKSLRVLIFLKVYKMQSL
jgi:hypothetical protein